MVRKRVKEFDKYAYYTKAVQSPDTDVEFVRDVYKELRRKNPKVLREDFCGTFAICCEWVKLGPHFEAHGVDLDPEPIRYGCEKYLPKLTTDQQRRVHIHNLNVLDKSLPSADVIAAFNFSYFIFKTRSELRKYFSSCRNRLNKDGLLLVDCFGGSACMTANEEETVHKDFSYYWDQVSFDPIHNHAVFHIHFKPKGMKKLEKVFSYDWRMWSIPELREVMEEAGFSKTHVYWEGTTKSGDGDGNFKRQEVGEDCEAWVCYVVGEK